MIVNVIANCIEQGCENMTILKGEDYINGYK